MGLFGIRLRRAAAGLLMGAVVASGCSVSTGTAKEPPSSATSIIANPSTVKTNSLGNPSTSSGTLPTACDLITRQDASEAFGEPAIAGDQYRDECWWSTTNDLKTVNVIHRADDLATWRSGYQNESWAPNGLGDEGYSGKALDSVVFRIGADQYEVNVVYSTAGDPRQVADDLAAIVLSRL
jgi:hypothetical protein